jgi:hypothetical protein
MRLLRTAGLLALTALVACSAHRIPGTDIRDTSDTRAIVAAIDTYRRAAERRDPGAVLALVSPKYFDRAGTPDPSDDIDYQRLKQRLGDDYKNITALRLDIAVKSVTVDGDEAEAYVFYDEYYRIATRAGEVAKRASDSHRMRFIREDGVWRFLSGL